MNTIGNFYFDNWLAIETSHFYIFICCNDDSVAGINFFLSKNVFRSTGTISFYLNRNS